MMIFIGICSIIFPQPGNSPAAKDYMLKQTLHNTDGDARRTIINLRNNLVLETPIFMPVGTQCTVKGLTASEIKDTGAKIILNNAYHVYLRPGLDLIEHFGGLHKFQGWDGAILTDSGGYQIFSLSNLHKLTEEGLTFKSHIDGSEHFMSPEKAIETQQRMGADIFMSFDQPCPWGASREETIDATSRTHRWAKRGRDAWKPETGQALFGIVQGGFEMDLRKDSAKTLIDMDFPGYSIGGLSVGEPKPMMWEMLAEVTPLLPTEKPRYMMGVGTPADLIRGVALGVDMFDCVLPTRLGRNGTFYTREGKANLRNAKFERDDSPLDSNCTCRVCRTYSRGYLRHLLKSTEMVGVRSLSYHNTAFYQNLMAEIRLKIENNEFKSFANEFLGNFSE